MKEIGKLRDVYSFDNIFMTEYRLIAGIIDDNYESVHKDDLTCLTENKKKRMIDDYKC